MKNSEIAVLYSTQRITYKEGSHCRFKKDTFYSYDLAISKVYGNHIAIIDWSPGSSSSAHINAVTLVTEDYNQVFCSLPEDVADAKNFLNYLSLLEKIEKDVRKNGRKKAYIRKATEIDNRFHRFLFMVKEKGLYNKKFDKLGRKIIEKGELLLEEKWK